MNDKKPIILHLETAGPVCSVAVSAGSDLISIRESDEKNSHSRVINIFIEEVLKEAERKLTDLDAVAVSEGPGSYTGLRIGVATAKGLCFSLDKHLIAVSTLQSMAAGMSLFTSDIRTEKKILLCPMIDARRMEVYSAVFDLNDEQIRETRAEIITQESFREFLKDHHLVFGGDGAEKCMVIFGNNPDVTFAKNYRISSSSMINLALKKFSKEIFEDTAYFEPHYLKEFVAGKPRVKGLR